jgi:long-subunit acyl-CoA synthetase (AMP-forming)
MHSAARPAAIALSDGRFALTYADLERTIHDAAGHLKGAGAKTLGLALDNTPLWAILDLAAIHAGMTVVPLPGFFSPSQLAHAIRDSGAGLILAGMPEYCGLLESAGLKIAGVGERELCGQKFWEIRLAGPANAAVPCGTAKVTYTSGTTGQPKGVCLGLAAMEDVAQSLCKASLANPDDRHLCLLPLATLLENIGGIYAPLLAGACSFVLPLQRVGLRGAAALDVAQMLGAMHECRASSVILVPQMLHGLVAALGRGAVRPASLRFAAVGGAPVSLRLLEQAGQLGLPVYEGYGLSECASVVTVNTPLANRPGSVGRLLPHARLGFSADGEIRVAGSVFSGYLGLEEKPDSDGFWPTGDTGYLDADGYLYLTGRKKNMFITSFGRNVAPEWVERELTIQPAIAQAAVFGEARPWNAAVIVPRALPGTDVNAAVAEAVAAANKLLPDYAQVAKWALAGEPFTPQNGMLTGNGRLCRGEILGRYESRINDLYEVG